eukprot:scaffold81840_cov34-Attheya_sp.AAC.1
MIVSPDEVSAAMQRAMASVNGLSIQSNDGTGHTSPVCIICNCLCDSSSLRWISRELLIQKAVCLHGPESLPVAARGYYSYTKEGMIHTMEPLLLSPHASYRGTKDGRNLVHTFSNCKGCLEHFETG